MKRGPTPILRGSICYAGGWCPKTESVDKTYADANPAEQNLERRGGGSSTQIHLKTMKNEASRVPKSIKIIQNVALAASGGVLGKGR